MYFFSWWQQYIPLQLVALSEIDETEQGMRKAVGEVGGLE